MHAEPSSTSAGIKKTIDETEFSSVAAEALRSYDQDFQTFFLAKLLGADISFSADTCVVTVRVRDFLKNPQGTLHGGIIATIFDISMGHLLNHALGGAGVTLEMKVQYLRPVRAGAVTCEARFNKQGRTINYLEAKMFDAAGVLIAAATSTWHQLPLAGANQS
ncbi:PaaI family thioesterase [Bradyrhizobium sp. Ash2021]|uniref:PaaI family thioesterase n=1 Tax=Bradyrhizobium sp. Ash2021 TaxID=2954771 RepID=UPI002815EF1B|nr:PaaI family thioesterase [Bradyrhizobium sp. Ash2021]WMT76327.1 PaaI family thioesterase [Bradyrhizobium sp. Ash2021]